jgi:predicted outer membrane lipoprotein
MKEEKMCIRMVNFLKAIVSLLFTGTLVASALTDTAAGYQINHQRGIQAFQPAAPQFIRHIDNLRYDSGWKEIGSRPDPISVEFTHNVGGNSDSYIVNLECRDNSTLGTYNCIDNGFKVNALWYDLTNATIKVLVAGIRPDSVRVRIYTAAPAYESGWKEFGSRPDPIPVELTHNLGEDPSGYFVSLECRDNSTLGTYDCSDHAFKVNALWYSLTDTTIKVWINRLRPDNVRVRIFMSPAAYDSGWRALGIRPDPISVEFSHNMGGDPGGYVVSLECRDDTTIATYNCTDQGFMVNAIWYGLTNTSIKVHATGGFRPDDVRVRIWRNYAVYLPTMMKAFDAP